jgi:hypothetical protein
MQFILYINASNIAAPPFIEPLEDDALALELGRLDFDENEPDRLSSLRLL